ncbi:glycosyltransferase family 2 protein [Azomonas macrocytogenes]|uniref:Glycosyltransferase 2-like domain-containing protein n=1 Tax=Azomonas macrocytogenes TaxID=69962 RepID=A0A839T5Q7_AZOMA|nr:glycosyltransferase family 2 protein [Azomonas macrocytogenes]MBB3104841.1 hypothetical protein [Azomonas macrocytogenes]
MNVALILNYKAATETVTCVESILQHCTSVDHIVLVDNDSQDGSVEAFNEWKQTTGQSKVTVLANPENNGYAGGNNYGIRWALNNLDITNFWIVNNDTYVDCDAFKPLQDALEKNDKQFVGSIILSAETGRLECYGGGKVYALLGKTKLLGKGLALENIQNLQDKPDYVMGCSLAFSKSLLDQVGLMDEEYFMYSEEVDWQYQAKKLGITSQVIPESRIYHHGSMSSGGRSAFYHYYRNRAAVRFNKRFYGSAFAFVSACLLSGIMAIQEFRKPNLVWSGIKGAFKGVTMSVK